MPGLLCKKVDNDRGKGRKDADHAKTLQRVGRRKAIGRLQGVNRRCSGEGKGQVDLKLLMNEVNIGSTFTITSRRECEHRVHGIMRYWRWS